MVGTRSHGKGETARGGLVPSVALAGAIVFPVIVALGGSFLLGKEIFQAGQAQARLMRTQEVRAQSRLLLENVWASLEDVKIRAALGAAPGVAHGVEMERGIESITRIDEKSFLAHGIAGVSPKTLSAQLREEGIAVIPPEHSIIGNAGHATRLGLVFRAAPNGLILAEVDPSRIFASFARWSTRREGGNLRGYLIDSKGRVLADSEPVYAGSDFSGTDVFQMALRSLFKGERVSGIATYTSADLRPVLTSYAGVGILPLAVVVERVIRPLGGAVLRQNVIPAILLLATVILLCGLSFALIRLLRISNTVPDFVMTPELEPALSRMAMARERVETERQRSRELSAGISGGTRAPSPSSKDEQTPAQATDQQTPAEQAESAKS